VRAAAVTPSAAGRDVARRLPAIGCRLGGGLAGLLAVVLSIRMFG